MWPKIRSLPAVVYLLLFGLLSGCVLLVPNLPTKSEASADVAERYAPLTSLILNYEATEGGYPTHLVNLFPTELPTFIEKGSERRPGDLYPNYPSDSDNLNTDYYFLDPISGQRQQILYGPSQRLFQWRDFELVILQGSPEVTLNWSTFDRKWVRYDSGAY